MSSTECSAPPAARSLLRLTAPWWGLALALAAGSVLLQLASSEGHADLRRTLDWQRAMLPGQPWRWWSAGFVHFDAMHLTANLAGCAAVAAFGTAAGLGSRASIAWFAAWPLTHLLLALSTGVDHYAGASGVLHAGVASGAVFVIARGRRGGGRRWLGIAVAAGLLAKLAQEQAWVLPVQRLPGWDFPVAVAAHAAGTLAGAACALAVLWCAPATSRTQ